MRIGRLRHLITIQTLKTIVNGCGDVKKDYVDFCKVWASVEPINANEKYLQKQVLKGIGVTSQILFNERKFDIKSIINPLEKNEKLILLATENEE